jgi:hypothetical protein
MLYSILLKGAKVSSILQLASALPDCCGSSIGIGIGIAGISIGNGFGHHIIIFLLRGVMSAIAESNFEKHSVVAKHLQCMFEHIS